MTVLRFRRADIIPHGDTEPLGNSDLVAAEALRRTEHVPELDAMCLDSRMSAIARTASAALDSQEGCCGVDEDRAQAKPKSEISDRVRVVLCIAFFFLVLAAVVGALRLRLETPIDRPAPASAPKVMT